MMRSLAARFAAVLIILNAAPARAVDPDRAEQYYMHVQESSVQTGLQTNVWVTFTATGECSGKATDPECLLTPLAPSQSDTCTTADDVDCLLTPLVDRKAKAVTWKVNGIPGGNSHVGTISGSGSSVVYTAPMKAPKRNPVAISAEIEGEAGLTLVGEVTVTPGHGWRGKLSWRFEGEKQEGAAGARGYNKVRILSRATYKVSGLLADSYNDDASGLVMLNLVPEDANYTLSSEGRSDCYYRTAWQGFFEPKDDHFPWMLKVDLATDQASSFDYVLSPVLHMSGYADRRECIEGLKPERYSLEPYDDVFPMFKGPFKGAPGDVSVFKGEVTGKQTANIQGQTVEGNLTVSWRFVRD